MNEWYGGINERRNSEQITSFGREARALKNTRFGTYWEERDWQEHVDGRPGPVRKKKKKGRHGGNEAKSH